MPSRASCSCFTVADVDVAGSNLEVTLSATNGTISISGDGSKFSTLTFSGTVADINIALDGLVFNPAANFSGAAGLQIDTSDLGNTGTGGIQKDSDTIAITVLDVGTPDIDLDADDSSAATGPNFTASFVEAGGPVAIADADATITDNGPATPDLVSMTVYLANPLDGADESLAADTTGTSIVASWDSGLGRLTLAGGAPQPRGHRRV